MSDLATELGLPVDLAGELGLSPGDLPPPPIEETFDPETGTRELYVLKRVLKVKQARRKLMPFVELTLPDPVEPDNSDLSQYDTQKFHDAVADALERCERGEIRRLIITMPPRMGKTELAVHRLTSWLMGRDPTRQIIVGTYNDTFAQDHGRKIRSIMSTKIYKQIFPNVAFAKGGEAVDLLATTAGGIAAFVGRGSATTGRGAHFFIIDDPIKDRIEANSPVTRDTVWEWFHDVVKTRMMDANSCIILIMTRWHEDDLVGRLTDSNNPHYIEEEAANWRIINLPALAEENDPIGRAPGEALWPTKKDGTPKFPVEYLHALRRSNPRTFSALHQQKPSPEDGTYYTRDMFRYYKKRDETPAGMRIYAASDHAVGEKQENDKTCLLVVGVDSVGDIWLLDCIWRRMGPKETIKHMLTLASMWRPIIWWAESGHIQKSIGPFLRDQQRAEHVWFSVSPIIPSADKVQRAQSMIGLMGMGRVKFPAFAPWCQPAVDEMLKFNNSPANDFVDTMSLIGLGLHRIVKGRSTAAPGARADAPKVGTLGWVKWASEREKREKALAMRRAA